METIVGPSLCCTTQQTSGLLFCCPISSPILGRQKKAGVWPSKVTLHHVVHSRPDMETMRRRWKKQWYTGSGLVCGGGGGYVKQSSWPPQGSCVSPQLPARHQRLQWGQIVEERVQNNSCLINQQVERAELQRSGAARATVSRLSQNSSASSSPVGVRMVTKKEVRW